MKLTSNIALLTLLRSGFIIKICDFDDAPIIKRHSHLVDAPSSKMHFVRTIRAERPKYHAHESFPLTRQGLTDALKWASEGYVTWTQDAKEMSK